MFKRTRSSDSESAAAGVPKGRSTPISIDGVHRVLGTRMAGPFPDGFDQLILGMGCFWGVERLFWELDGVFTTAAGYSGGQTPNPTYEETSTGATGHAEVVLVVYDPELVSMQDLLAVFWENHDPTTPHRPTGFSSQYRSALFTTTDEQYDAAIASRDHYQQRLSERGYTKIRTEIARAGELFYAEDYHQQYMHTHPRALCANGFCQVSYT